MPYRADQLIVTEYQPGQGIPPPHRRSDLRGRHRRDHARFHVHHGADAGGRERTDVARAGERARLVGRGTPPLAACHSCTRRRRVDGSHVEPLGGLCDLQKGSDGGEGGGCGARHVRRGSGRAKKGGRVPGTSDQRLVSERFPRSSQYHPEWVLANASGGANSLWLTEWLATALDLRPGMRVLDLGCGRASSSIFLRREFGVQVWATDLWFSASENMQRIRDAGVEDGVFPIHADARSLPFAAGVLRRHRVHRLLLLLRDGRPVPELPRAVREAGRPGRHRRGRTGAGDRRRASRSSSRVVDAGSLGLATRRPGGGGTGSGPASWTSNLADTMPDGWKVWLDWHRAVAPDNATEIKAIEADGGGISATFVSSVVAGAVKLEEYCWPDTMRSLPAVHEEALLGNED